MKRALIILTLFPTASVAIAAVGSHVDTSFYVADGVVLDQQTDGTLVPNRVESTRFYDSTKGAEWVTSLKSDSLMCWAHAAANSIQYWQSYYGVFAKPQQGIYFTDDGTQVGSLYPQTSFNEMPLPYGNIGTDTTTILGDDGMYEDTQYNIPNPKFLDVARDMYHNISDNMGGTIKAAAEWFFRGQTDLQGDNGFYFKSQYTGGYYKNYYESIPQDTEVYTQPQNLNGLAYTTVYSAAIEALGDKNNSTTGSAFANTDLNAVKNIILKGFGIDNGKQVQSGNIPVIGLWNDNGTGHFITCYGFTTDSDGNLESILIADSDDKITWPSNISQRYVAIENDKIVLYTDKNLSSRWSSYYIGEVSYINTPQVLQNMLAEYSNVSNEAQVWNGHSGVWEQQTASTEALPTESTGWDIHVNGSNIDSEHHGYYHTYATDSRAVLFDDHAEEDKRQITINGTVSASLIEVAATGYEFKAGENAALAAGADMLIRQAATLHSDLALNLANLTLEAGASLSSKEPIVVTGTFIASLQAATTFSLKNAVTVPARVDADLDLSAAKQIILETSVSLNNHTLTLAEGQTITLSSVDENLPFFTDISQLIIGGTQIAEGTDLGEYLVFVSPDNKEYTNISFIYQNNSIWAASIPEPTTATLSLIALAALATRRRRAAAKASA
ncbi:MAG: hypothetical protein IJA81_04205 [Akkermansia sp.]|nr:hypothetical protein [Akkermansia sp.]